MQEDNFVSLWIGNFPSEESLMEYVQVRYDEDGNSIVPQFMMDFNLDRWEEGFREASFVTPPNNNVAALLSGVSHEISVIPQFTRIIGTHSQHLCNSVILLYNYKHHPKSLKKLSGPIQLNFVGTVEYQQQ